MWGFVILFRKRKRCADGDFFFFLKTGTNEMPDGEEKGAVSSFAIYIYYIIWCKAVQRVILLWYTS